jgi:hypothetical protein
MIDFDLDGSGPGSLVRRIGIITFGMRTVFDRHQGRDSAPSLF